MSKAIEISPEYCALIEKRITTKARNHPKMPRKIKQPIYTTCRIKRHTRRNMGRHAQNRR